MPHDPHDPFNLREEQPELYEQAVRAQARGREVDAMEDLIRSAASDGDLSKLQAFLAAEPELNSEDDYISGPLLAAVNTENLEVVRMLLDAGADPLRVHEDGVGRYSPLGIAGVQGSLEIVRLVWATHPVDKLNQHENGQRCSGCLVFAATYGRTALVEYLLRERPAGLIWDAPSLARALVGAAQGWHVHTASVLLDHVKTYTRETLQCALLAAVDYKVTGPRDITDPEYRVVDFINQELLVKRLIEAGMFDLNALDTRGVPLVHRAIYGVNLVGALRAVLAKGKANMTTTSPSKTYSSALGADPVARDEKGKTPLQHVVVTIAVDEMQRETGIHETGIHLLLEHGASPTAADHSGETPLHAAAFGSPLHIFRHLLRSTTTPHVLSVTNNHGETLLHYAAAGGNIPILRFLLESAPDLDVNDCGPSGWTPLLCALAPTLIGDAPDPQCPSLKTFEAAVQAAQLLLSHGADAARVSAEGWSALHCLAYYKSHPGDTRFSALAEALVRKGAPLSAGARYLEPDPMYGGEWSETGFAASGGFPWGYRMGRLVEAAPEGAFSGEEATALGWARRFGARAVEGVLLSHSDV